jgi:hypothetical protein
MSIETELDAYISGFHLDALSSGLPLNVDLDTTRTVIAGNQPQVLRAAGRTRRLHRLTPPRGAILLARSADNSSRPV